MILLLAGCGNQVLYMCKDGTPGGGQVPEKSSVVFVCPDGTETKDITRCSFEKQTTVKRTDAEKFALNFVKGYVQAAGWQASLINAYTEEGEWYAQVVVSKRDENPFETLVKIDGKKGIASCETNCAYITP